jgi:eukaryotic-like serine/threonine-protein kinase
MNPIQSGRVIAGKYRLEACRARGGMGSVWAARHLRLDTLLAIKFIDPQFASLPEARGRFEREAKTVASLCGTNVAQIHDYGIEDEIPYIAMELLHGEDLSARLSRVGRLPQRTAVHIVHQVARVLRRAHEAGIIHRDLKPGNIFLARGDDDEEIVKVLDFGVAKTLLSLDAQGDPTKSGTLVGSPRYMSPEQARGIKSIDHRSDLWSLGVIAFRMVTGQLPFPGTEIGDLILKICSEPAPLPSRFVPGAAPEIDRFFARALERAPEKRFQSAGEMARAFAAAMGESPPSSFPSFPLGAEGGIAAAGAPISVGDSVQRSAPKEAAKAPASLRPGVPSSDPARARTSNVERTLASYLPEELSIPFRPCPRSRRRARAAAGSADPVTPHETGLSLSNAPPDRAAPPRLFMATATSGALFTGLGWTTTGAAVASLLLGTFLLLSRSAPSAPSPSAPGDAPVEHELLLTPLSVRSAAPLVPARAPARAAAVDAAASPPLACVPPSSAPAPDAARPPSAQKSAPRRPPPKPRRPPPRESAKVLRGI